MARDLKRHVGQLTYVAGQPQHLDIPRDFVIKTMYLLIKATITVHASDTTQTYPLPMNLIRRIQLQANGYLTLKDLEGPVAFWTAQRQRRQGLPVHCPWTADSEIYCMCLIPIDFYQERSVQGPDSMLPSYRYKSLRLQITWGDAADAHESGNTTVDAATCDVILHEIRDIGGKFLVFKQSQLIHDIGAAGTQIQTPQNGLPVGNFYRAFDYFIFGTPDGGRPNSPLELNDWSGTEPAVVTRLRVVSNGVDVHRDLDFPEFPAVQMSEVGLSDCADDASANVSLINTRFFNPHLYVDFSEDGRQGGWINTVGLSSFVIESDLLIPAGDPAAPRRIVIVPHEMVPPRPGDGVYTEADFRA